MFTRTRQLLGSTAHVVTAPWRVVQGASIGNWLRGTAVVGTVAGIAGAGGGGWYWIQQQPRPGTPVAQQVPEKPSANAPQRIPLPPDDPPPADAPLDSSASVPPEVTFESRSFPQATPTSWDGEDAALSPADASNAAGISDDPNQFAPNLYPAPAAGAKLLPPDSGLPPPGEDRFGVSVTGVTAVEVASDTVDAEANATDSTGEAALAPAPEFSSLSPPAPAPLEGAEPAAAAADSLEPAGESPREVTGPGPTRFPEARSAPARRVAAPPYLEPASDQDPGEPASAPPSAEQAPPSSIGSGTGSEGSAARVGAVPGDRQLEGVQSPTLAVEKAAPEEIRVGEPALFEIYIRNVGRVAAHEVIVRDQVPRGTRLVGASPAATDSGGQLVWNLGTLEPGAEAKLTLELLPEAEGEIGSVAEVEFRTQASVRTLCTRPELAVEQSAPPRVMIGEQFTLNITVANTGTGAATGVVLEEDVPTGLSHPAGTALEYPVGTLRPGETRNLQLTLTATEPGTIENVLVLRGEGDLIAEHRARVEVISPQLQVNVEGPSRRYLERQVTFDVAIANAGTAAATNVNLVARLPRGMEFLSADNKGQYDSQQHAVYWSLEELPAQDVGVVKLTALPIEPGEQRLLAEGQADLGLTAAHEHRVQVEGAPELVFTVTDTADPIEVGADTLYEVQVTNKGAKTVTQVQISAAIADGLEALRGEGPTEIAVQGPQFIAAPLPRLAPQETATFRFFVRGRQEGDQLIRVQLVSDESQTPVTKEESTRVYADR